MHGKVCCFILFLSIEIVSAQTADPYKADFSAPKEIDGMSLAWHDEFNNNGKPDPHNWKYESGFVRNKELQWYQADNANCSNGLLVIEGRREETKNPNYKVGSTDWKTSRPVASYTSASVKTQGLQQWMFGRFEIRARIDTALGSWPAIWTLGISGRWPLNGEVDIMEYYRLNNVPFILANMAWGRAANGGPVWNTKTVPFDNFLSRDTQWPKKFHIWRMDWNKDSISLFLDDELLNTIDLRKTINPDGSNPFLQPQYLLLNLAIGANGGDPSNTSSPIKYEVDYVRYYKFL